MTEGDMILAALLIAGFALLGALITLSNIRQTRALREVGEVLHGWAIRHIQLTRAIAAGTVRVEDPTAWLRETLTRLLPADGASFRELSLERHGPGWILFRRDGGWVLLARPEVDPSALARGSRLAPPVIPPRALRKARVLELSPVTAWPTLDLELAAAWRRWFPDEPPPERARALILPNHS